MTRVLKCDRCGAVCGYNDVYAVEVTDYSRACMLTPNQFTYHLCRSCYPKLAELFEER